MKILLSTLLLFLFHPFDLSYFLSLLFLGLVGVEYSALAYYVNIENITRFKRFVRLDYKQDTNINKGLKKCQNSMMW
jgi:hypothetical protein